MSTSQRYVAVKLIAGKKYVLRNGRHVTVRENPHWQCRVNYPFAVIQGPHFVVYYDEEGNTGGGTAHEHDIMRPVYEEGQTYIDGDNNRVTITRVDAHTCTYPVHGDDGEEYTLDGKYLDDGSENSESNLFDYVRKAVDAIKPAPRLGDLLREAVAAPALPVFAPMGGIPIPPPVPADPWMGKRVQFNQDGERGTGIVRGFDGTNYAVEVDESCTEFSGGHYCGNLVPGGRGWFVHPRNLTAIDGITAVPSIVHYVSLDLPILATPVTPSRVGMRVEVQLDCATTVQATIMHEDAAHVAIEFDPDYYHAGAWTCDGHVPSGRGWYVPKDSVRAVSEAETQVEAERSEAEALNEVDVAEVWAAYRINPSISIDAWIAARRQLKAAAK